MTRCNSPHRLPLTPVPAWPAPLRAEWAQLTSPVQDLFAPANRAGDWAPATFRQAEQGLGKLVSHIRASGPIDDTVGILGLVSEPALQGFVAGMIAEGLAPGTQASYLNGIWLAARAIAPTRDWRWIGHGLTKVRASIRKLPLVKAAAVRTDQLFALGRRLFTEVAANADPPTFAQARMARDGLLIAILALRPLRRKNIWSLTLGEHVLADVGGTHISIPAEQMKMQKLPYEADWPEQLSAELKVYLSKFRPVLVQRYNVASRKPPAGNALWVSERGTQLDDSGIYKQITKLTAKEFGRPVNPHRFRHAAGGTVAVGAPEHVHLVSPVLGHYDPRSREFYIEADQVAAARRAHAFEDEFIERIEFEDRSARRRTAASV